MTYMQVLYNSVNYACGEFVQNMQVDMTLQSTYFNTPADINTYLTPIAPITDPAILNAMFNDPFYGLGNFENYAKWNILLPGNVNVTYVNQKLAF
jgi:hypothetical protein